MLTNAMKLPTIVVDGMTLLKQFTLVLDDDNGLPSRPERK